MAAHSKGHWPRGKRRTSADPARVTATLVAVRRVLDHPEIEVRSIRAAARACGVHERSLRRWLDGQLLPMSYHLTLLARWTRVQWRAIKREHAKP